MHFCHQEAMLIVMAFDPAFAIWMQVAWGRVLSSFNRG